MRENSEMTGAHVASAMMPIYPPMTEAVVESPIACPASPSFASG